MLRATQNKDSGLSNASQHQSFSYLYQTVAATATTTPCGNRRSHATLAYRISQPVPAKPPQVHRPITMIRYAENGNGVSACTSSVPPTFPPILWRAPTMMRMVRVFNITIFGVVTSSLFALCYAAALNATNYAYFCRTAECDKIRPSPSYL